MRVHRRITALWQVIAVGVIVSLWLGLIGLFVIAHGDIESFLHETLKHSKHDDFYDLNRVFILFWVVHSSLAVPAVAAARSRRSDVLAVLLIGPAIGLAISVPWQRWGDPNWAEFVGVCLIGWLVGTTVSCVYWFKKGAESPTEDRIADLAGHGHRQEEKSEGDA